MLFASLAAAIDAGAPAPDFTVAAADGKPLQLSAYRGKLVYLDFWASWCAPCRRSFPWMNAMQEKYGAGGLVVLGVNVDQRRPDAERFLAQVPARFMIAYDPQGAAPALYAIKGMPGSVLIDPQGRVVFAHAGFRDADRDELEAKIRAALPPRAN
ncbi:MAG: TlpA family protein disulfide reductase [Betaproteobacteria bacterium]|nr:TlpA family protein disulfide reductase [Betaproteobacteria bacterium]